jgi:hypothetical protein
MPLVGFESTTPIFEQAKTVRSLDRAATVIGNIKLYPYLRNYRAESFCPHKMNNRKLLFGRTLLKYGRHFVYWNQSLNMRMLVFYLDCHETGLCCYLVIHIENLLLPLQLFYFHLWRIYWLFFVFYIILENYKNHETGRQDDQPHRALSSSSNALDLY